MEPPNKTRAVRIRKVSWAFWGSVIIVLATPGQLQSQATPSPGQNILAGSRVFGMVGCARCHAVEGVGGDIGPDLGRAVRSQSYHDLAAAIWNHLPQMAASMDAVGISRPYLDPWEAGDLVAFLTWFDYFDRSGDVAVGRRLFEDKHCIACHRVGDAGGVVGPSLDVLVEVATPIQIATAMWNHGPAMAEAMESRGLERPSFRGSEFRDLIAFLKSTASVVPTGNVYVLPGRADVGRRRFTEQHCIDCHAVGGRGGNIGPDLSRGRQFGDLTEFAAAMWNKAPSMTRAMERTGIMVPTLTAADMSDLVAYLISLRYFGEQGNADRGARQVRAKGCLSCHALRGSGGETAVDLASGGVRINSPESVIAALWNHIRVVDTTMTEGWPTFDAAEMADLAAFLDRLGRPQR